MNKDDENQRMEGLVEEYEQRINGQDYVEPIADADMAQARKAIE
jgi:hypothetical protein